MQNITSRGGGSLHHATQSLEEKKCPCSQNNNTDLGKQSSLFDTALVKAEPKV